MKISNSFFPSALVGAILLDCSVTFVTASDSVAPTKTEKIVGGVPVAAGTYPFHGISDDGRCGFSLIAGDTLLTAATCRSSFRPGDRVLLGGVLKDGSDADSILTVREVFLPDDDGSTALANQLMIVGVEEDMSTSPVAAWNDNAAVPAIGDTAVAIGFEGDLNDDYYYFGDDETLTQVQMAIRDENEVACAWSGHDVDKLICAGGENGRSTCFGDTGSPLLVDGTLVGVATQSFGCFGNERPSLFVRVSEVDLFIKEGVCSLTQLPKADYCDQFPTPAPTVTPPPPPNDACIDAEAIGLGMTPGSTLGSTFDDVGFCGTINSSPGVWYTIVGDGKTNSVDTCEGTSFDTRLTVFSGGCGALSCITGNDQSADSLCGENGSSVQWETEDGVTYHILVHGNFEFAGAFTLNVNSFVPPTNAICPDAITLSLDSSVSGSTALSSVASDFNGISCGPTIRAPGVWYRVIGTGSVIRASTCTESIGFFLDTVLTVFSGCDDSASCITFNDEFCGSQSTVEWETAPGEDYYVLVHGYFSFESGPFELTVTELTPPENDLCSNAIAIEVDSTTAGSTTTATVPTSFEGCPFTVRSPGVWYKTVGTGARFSASTCTGTDFDSTLTVFSGCESPTCIESNDEFCGSQSKVTWDTVNGEEYFVLVHAFFSDASGSFELRLEADDSLPATPNPFAAFMCFIRSWIDRFVPGDWAC